MAGIDTLTMGPSKYIPNFRAGFGDNLYLHYWWENYGSADSALDFGSYLLQAKNTILRNAADKFIYENPLGTAQLSQDELGMLDFMFNGKEIPSLGNSQIAQKQQIEASDGNFDIVNAIMDFRDAVAKGADIQLGIAALGNFIATSTSTLTQEIQEYVLLNWNNAKQNATVSQVINKAVVNLKKQSNRGVRLLKKPSESSFARLSSATQRALVYLYAIGDGNISGVSEKSIYKYLTNLSSQAWNDIQGTLGEASNRLIRGKAAELIGSAMNKNNNRIQSIVNTSKDLVGATVKLDEIMAKTTEAVIRENAKAEQSFNISYQNGGDAIVAFAATQSKSDESIYMSTGVTVGTSIKTTRSLALNDAGDLVAGKIHIQSSTSLYTALIRELGISGTEYVHLLQLVSAQGADGNTDAALDLAWEQMKEYVTYGMVVSGLVGMVRYAQPTLIQINDNIIPMGVFIHNLVNSMTVEQSAYGGVSIEGFPDRNDFSNLARYAWVAPMSRANTESAEIRSSDVYSLMTNKLYKTKISILLTNLNLTYLAQSVRF